VSIEQQVTNTGVIVERPELGGCITDMSASQPEKNLMVFGEQQGACRTRTILTKFAAPTYD